MNTTSSPLTTTSLSSLSSRAGSGYIGLPTAASFVGIVQFNALVSLVGRIEKMGRSGNPEIRPSLPEDHVEDIMIEVPLRHV